MKSGFGFAAAMLLLGFAGQAAGSAAIDTDESRITATMRQMGVPVEGRFKTISGTVRFDPEHLDQASTRLVIDTTSFDIGMSDFNREVAKPEWLDSKAHPEAIFEAEGLKALGDDVYEVTGTLSLKGRVAELTTRLKVATTDQGRRFSGEWPLKRQDFAIGDSGWDGVVDETVLVRFSIHQPVSP